MPQYTRINEEIGFRIVLRKRNSDLTRPTLQIRVSSERTYNASVVGLAFYFCDLTMQGNFNVAPTVDRI